jgi:peptidoglycan/LPS O-acetylase OafA/YrhL
LVAAIAGTGLGPRATALLVSRPLLWLGERSYSLYLWHFLVGTVAIAGGREDFQGPATTLAMVSLSLVAAAASYRWIERPMRDAINGLA